MKLVCEADVVSSHGPSDTFAAAGILQLKASPTKRDKIVIEPMVDNSESLHRRIIETTVVI